MKRAEAVSTKRLISIAYMEFRRKDVVYLTLISRRREISVEFSASILKKHSMDTGWVLNQPGVEIMVSQINGLVSQENMLVSQINLFSSQIKVLGSK
jgi:hypothetical protein